MSEPELPDNFRTDIRKRYPGKCRKADHEGSRSCAIFEKCMECQGADVDGIRHCTVRDCGLYQYRPYRTKDDRPLVPSLKQYAKWNTRPKPSWLKKKRKEPQS